jgi:hypothetical protein
VRSLSGGSEASSSVYNVTGHAWANDQQLRWDVVLKVIRPTVDRLDSAHWNYWKREAYAYRSEWLRWDAAGLAAPRCYDISERADGSIWLWLEALRDAVSRPGQSRPTSWSHVNSASSDERIIGSPSSLII